MKDEPIKEGGVMGDSHISGKIRNVGQGRRVTRERDAGRLFQQDPRMFTSRCLGSRSLEGREG